MKTKQCYKYNAVYRAIKFHSSWMMNVAGFHFGTMNSVTLNNDIDEEECKEKKHSQWNIIFLLEYIYKMYIFLTLWTVSCFVVGWINRYEVPKYTKYENIVLKRIIYEIGSINNNAIKIIILQYFKCS